ncbi:MAG: FAD-dependent oxidoreductase [Minisyncoccota bacterium]
MKIRILGAGFYGLHSALALLADGHDVEVWDIADHVFAGASGNCPARLHLGATHYPRSGATQAACRGHQAEFLEHYGFLTRHVRTNIYAIAAQDSLVDFESYCRTLKDQVEFITIYDPAEYGLQNVEGAVLTGERHVVTDMAAAYFTRELGDLIKLSVPAAEVDDPRWDVSIDATFGAMDSAGIDRYEPCLTVMLEGPTDTSVTIMDGPFVGTYVWNESLRLSSLTSAKLTPFSKTCQTYGEARALLNGLSVQDLADRAEDMMGQMAFFWPATRDLYRIVDFKTAIRAMPRSGADSRLVDVRRVGAKVIKVRAGKIDAIFQAERAVKDIIAKMSLAKPMFQGW